MTTIDTSTSTTTSTAPAEHLRGLCGGAVHLPGADQRVCRLRVAPRASGERPWDCYGPGAMPQVAPPPPLEPGGPYDFASERRYADAQVPDTESLKTTLERVEPYWEEEIEHATIVSFPGRRCRWTN